jgi:phosphatidate phosphatase APP1
VPNLPLPALRQHLVRWLTAAEQALDDTLAGILRGRRGWELAVLPYVGSGTPARAHLRARVVLRRTNRVSRRVLSTSLGRYLAVEVRGEAVTVEVAGRSVEVVSAREGYVETDLDLPGLAPGWHDVRWTVARTSTAGRLLVVDPQASLGLVSDIDDTVIHTGLTRAYEAVRNTLLVPDEDRLPIPGAAELYRALVAGDAGRAPVFYVSTGAWNLHEPMEQFLARNGFPAGPLVMTDWGPGVGWLFREGSVAFKSRVVIDLVDEHPHLRWVLVGDSGQHDPEAYASVVRARPGRVAAVYIREVLPESVTRAAHVRRLADELAQLGVPMLLIRESAEAQAHAAGLGLLVPGGDRGTDRPGWRGTPPPQP